jgi:hypothetical protein
MRSAGACHPWKYSTARTQFFYGPGGDLRPVPKSELAQHMVDVVFNRPFGQVQPGGDLFAGQAIRNEAGDLQLTLA